VEREEASYDVAVGIKTWRRELVERALDACQVATELHLEARALRTDAVDPPSGQPDSLRAAAVG
jgi:hypothetical protein